MNVCLQSEHELLFLLKRTSAQHGQSHGVGGVELAVELEEFLASIDSSLPRTRQQRFFVPCINEHTT